MNEKNGQFLRLKAVIDRTPKSEALIYHDVCCGTFSSLSKLGPAESAGRSADVISLSASFEFFTQNISIQIKFCFCYIVLIFIWFIYLNNQINRIKSSATLFIFISIYNLQISTCFHAAFPHKGYDR